MGSIKFLAVIGLLAAVPATAMAHDHERHERRHWRAVPPTAYLAPVVRPVWIPGYWVRRGPRPAWTAGAWVTPPQVGYTWVAPQWEWHGPHRQWVWREGYWAQPAPGYPQYGEYNGRY
jgi:hypothetical protein